MWKAPKRPNNEVSQTYNDGIVRIYSVTDRAEAGKQPKKRLKPKEKLNFAELRLGIRRYYDAKQNQTEISRVIRTQHRESVSNQDVAIIEGKQYRIDLVQMAFDVYPASMDISLSVIEQKYTEMENGGNCCDMG